MLKGSKIALLACGSFNPPTNLHFRMMERAKDFLELEMECQVLTGVMSPVADNFGKEGLISAAHRFQMLKLGAASSSWIQPDDWECTRTQWFRTLAVLKHHNQRLKEKFGADLRLMLVCGGDFVDSFTRVLEDGSNLWDPKDVETILREYGIIVLEREGANPEASLSVIPGIDLKLNNAFVIEDAAFPNGISSTRLRETLKRGHSVRYCTPDAVVDYIEENNLYRKMTSK